VADKLIQRLRDVSMDLEKEKEMGTFESYLGVDMIKQNDGSMKLYQIGLISHIIDTMGLHNAALKDTPATEVIGQCLDSKVFDESYNMWLVVGMLLYLTNTLHADCASAMNQCACFAHDPREPHHKALK
jgi:hypothetical protein